MLAALIIICIVGIGVFCGVGEAMLAAIICIVGIGVLCGVLAALRFVGYLFVLVVVYTAFCYLMGKWFDPPGAA